MNDLHQTEPVQSGSLENGINGRYNFGINAVFKESWHKTKGAKSAFLGAVNFIFLVSLEIYYVQLLLCFGLILFIALDMNQLHNVVAAKHAAAHLTGTQLIFLFAGMILVMLLGLLVYLP